MFQALLSDALNHGLPYQISFETHYWNLWTFSTLHLALFEALHFAGYRLVSWDHNVRCPSCNEFTVVRLYC